MDEVWLYVLVLQMSASTAKGKREAERASRSKLVSHPCHSSIAIHSRHSAVPTSNPSVLLTCVTRGYEPN